MDCNRHMADIRQRSRWEDSSASDCSSPRPQPQARVVKSRWEDSDEDVHSLRDEGDLFNVQHLGTPKTLAPCTSSTCSGTPPAHCQSVESPGASMSISSPSVSSPQAAPSPGDPPLALVAPPVRSEAPCADTVMDDRVPILDASDAVASGVTSRTRSRTPRELRPGRGAKRLAHPCWWHADLRQCLSAAAELPGEPARSMTHVSVCSGALTELLATSVPRGSEKFWLAQTLLRIHAVSVVISRRVFQVRLRGNNSSVPTWCFFNLFGG